MEKFHLILHLTCQKVMVMYGDGARPGCVEVSYAVIKKWLTS